MHLQRAFGRTNKSPIEKYDALQDKFASFYFSGYGIKKHLKKLKKVIELEPHQRGYREYTQLLNQKLTQLEEEENSIKFKIKPYEQSLKPSSLHKLKKIQNFFEESKSKDTKNNTQLQLFSKDKGFFKNLPKISKSNCAIPRCNELPQDLNSSLEKEKEVKSISTIDRLIKHPKRVQKLIIARDRSDNSLQMNKNPFKKESEESEIKEVKHQDFIKFLKQKQEDLSRQTRKSIKEEENNEFEE